MWSDARRRARKLLRFAETEASGGRDLVRASELTPDPLLRRLFLRHAQDEQRHAEVFRRRARAILEEAPAGADGRSALEADWLAPGERGLDELQVAGETQSGLLAFLHLSEGAAARRFVLYRQSIAGDEATRAVFADVLRDEEFHMAYTRKQLARVAPRLDGRALWIARAKRLWKAYLRAAVGIASVIGSVVLLVQYFVLLPPFALLARRAARSEPDGFAPARPAPPLGSQY